MTIDILNAIQKADYKDKDFVIINTGQNIYLNVVSEILLGENGNLRLLDCYFTHDLPPETFAFGKYSEDFKEGEICRVL